MRAKPVEVGKPSFRGEGADTDRCTCDHERDLHLADQCVGCSDRLGCYGFVLRPAVDREAVTARVATDLASLSDFDLERAEKQIARLAGRRVRP